jgi:hypothetical protein
MKDQGRSQADWANARKQYQEAGMSSLTQELASEVVAAFLAELDPAAKGRLGEAQLERLELLVQEAVSAGIHDAAERMESLVRELRSEAGTPEIEL